MIPSTLLRSLDIIEPYRGNTALGESYGTPRDIKARFEGKRRMVKSADGVDVICSATAYVRPDEDVPMQSKYTHIGRTYVVMEVLPQEGLHGAELQELLLS